jgi:hypothetical protein
MPNGRANEEVVVLAIGPAPHREETLRGAAPGIALERRIERVLPIEQVLRIEQVIAARPETVAAVPSAATRVVVLAQTAVAVDQVWALAAAMVEAAVDGVEAGVDSVEAEAGSAEVAVAAGGEGEDHETDIKQTHVGGRCGER